jgi:anti-anti-sigma factor
MLRLSFFGLHGRLIFFVFLVIAPAVALIYYTGHEHHERAIAETEDHALRMAQVVNAYKEEQIVHARQVLRAVSLIPAVREHKSLACKTTFAALDQRYPDFTDFAVATPDGNVFCHSSSAFPLDEGINVADKDWFDRSVQIRNFVVSEAIISPTSNEPILLFGYPTFDNEGNLVAVLSLGLKLSQINSFIAEIPLPPGTVASLLSQDGTILSYYPQPERWVGKQTNVAPIAEAAATGHGQGTIEMIGLDGTSRLYAIVTLQYTEQWLYLNVGIPSDIAYGVVDRMWQRNLAWIGIIIIFEAVVAGVVGNLFILRPLKTLMSATQQLARGDRSTRIDTSRRLGELRRLAHHFNMMASELQQHERSLRDAESRYRLLIEQVPAVIYTIAFNPLRLTYVSPRIESLLGIAADELIAQENAWQHSIHPDDRDRVLQSFQRMLDQTRPGSSEKLGSFRAEYRLQARDGWGVWVRDDAEIIFDEEGNPQSLQGTLVDISEQKQAEEVILAQAATLRKLSTPLLHIREGVLLMPLVGTIDTQRASLMMETVLQGVEQQRARVVLLDITGVAVVDSQVAQAFIQIANAIQLLGARVILTGIRPEVAQTIVNLGLDLSSITSHSTLQSGIAHALHLVR